MSAHSMVTSKTNLKKGFANGCHWPGMAKWLGPHEVIIAPGKAVLKAY